MCFEILGFDVIIDDKLKPWLLEINYTPSFTTDTPLDKVIKEGVIEEAIQIMNLHPKQKIEYLQKERDRINSIAIYGRGRQQRDSQR